MRTLSLALVLLCACGPEAPSSLEIVSIEPEEVLAGQETELRVQLNAPVPFRFDYSRGTLQLPEEVALQVGGQATRLAWLEADGRLVFVVPEQVPEGTQQVEVGLPGGKRVRHEPGLRVLPSEPLTPSAEGITRLSIDPIGDQVVGRPFELTVRAEGPQVAGFNGQVVFTSSKGDISPRRSESFSGGRRVERVTVSKPGQLFLIVHLGQLSARSNSFRVKPKP
jgi:hypothetical protein